MGQANRPRNRSRAAALVATLGVQALIVAAVIAGLAEQSRPAKIYPINFSSVKLPLESPPPPPPPPPHAVARQNAGPAGRIAVAQPLAAPSPDITLSIQIAPVVAETGVAPVAGAANSGAGPGAGGSGGGAGGGAHALVQIGGTIDSAKDFPRASRDLRIGHSVLIAFTVGTDGRVHDCHVREPSSDPASDAVTCRLAAERFRFRPAVDGDGHPVEAQYGWRQRWHF